MKKLSFVVIVCIAAFCLASCNDGSDDAVESANESNKIKRDSALNTGTAQSAGPVSLQDSKFAVEAASGGMMEVQLGELAQQKASSQRVKDFGAMMVRDHSDANAELRSLAGMKNITLPPAPGQGHMDHIKKLSEKSGVDFDKAYMKLMVDDHQKDVDKFEKCSTNAKDEDVKAFAAKILPVLKAHLDSAKVINDALK